MPNLQNILHRTPAGQAIRMAFLPKPIELDYRDLEMKIMGIEPIERIVLDDNGNLPKWAWPGGYPIIYLDENNETICPDCANNYPDDEPPIHAWFIFYEGAPDQCSLCGKEIESAYGDPDD